MVNIKFYLKQGYTVEAYNCSEEDVTRVRSQFDDGNLIVVKNLNINQQEVTHFVIHLIVR
nr:MAG TPA: hypothetical protein [Caudoviricetes sp.]